MSEVKCKCGNVIQSHNANRGMTECMECKGKPSKKEVLAGLIMVWLDKFGMEWVDLEKYLNEMGEYNTDDMPSFGLLEHYGFLENWNGEDDEGRVYGVQLRLTSRAMKFLQDDSVLRLQ